MTTMTALAAVTLTTTEKGNVSAVGMSGSDAAGNLSCALMDLQAAKTKLAFVSANMGAGANKTAIDAMITALT